MIVIANLIEYGGGIEHYSSPIVKQFCCLMFTGLISFHLPIILSLSRSMNKVTKNSSA